MSSLTFNKATIEGPSSVFNADYIRANKLLVKTSMAEINGVFWVNDSLTLDTVEAPINASITLVNDRKRRRPTHLTLDTGNGAIDAAIHLLAPRAPSGHHHATFMTSMKTFSAPIKVSVKHDDSTPPSEFHLRAQNNLAETAVILDPKYEGTFDLHTKLAQAVLKEQSNKVLVADPTGNGGLRKYQLDHKTSTRMYGWVGWGQRPGPATGKIHQGHVEVVSSHSPVSLRLDGSGSLDQGQS